ncbi:MAG: hypothetical protein Q7S16_02800 [bacterium]|nr:hypothetical protein [bacterium]
MNVFDIRPLLTAQFWFNTNPPPLLPFFEKAFFIVYIVMLVVALVLGVLGGKTKDPIRRTLFEKLRRKEMTFGVMGLFLAFFSYERTPVLSMHFFTGLLWVLILGVWGGMIAWWRFRVAPKLQKQGTDRKEFEKYLPK